MGGRCVEQYRPLPNGLLTSRQGHRRSAHCLPYCEGRHCRHLGPHSSDQLKYRLHLEKSRVCISSEELVTTDTLVSPTLNPIVAPAPNPFDADNDYFPTPLQRFSHLDKYSRFRYDLGRRETWVETVTRASNYLRKLS